MIYVPTRQEPPDWLPSEPVAAAEEEIIRQEPPDWLLSEPVAAAEAYDMC